MTEADFIPILCALLLGGEPEVRLNYQIVDGSHHVRVDCLTPTHSIEIGLDGRRSSLDSVQQALFGAQVSGRAPMVVIIDTNGVEDAIEYRVETGARAAGVSYHVIDAALLIRLQMTAPFRAARARVLAETAAGS